MIEHQVLARKWRPRNFVSLAGQEHVQKALVNALERNRLHHAYLFTGTRGVGKTTIARILAKCLNCEQGVTAQPCDTCSTCVEINEGRCVDLIEVDAASRTKVEDTRELLDNVQYAPTRARYKIYLIDEVHMLSTHSFNALLKTLEEPPEHVKFLLATTDPQKLPVTVLSRCLQFNLKNLTVDRITSHLETILGQEQVDFELAALRLLAHAADGSMRDALSLTDQAIAYGNNTLIETDVATMLGTVDRNRIIGLIESIATNDAQQVMDQIDQLASYAPDFPAVLEGMISVLHRIAVVQAVPDIDLSSVEQAERISELAGALKPEDTQLFYQIALIGRRDLPLNPEPRAGLEMVILRMLAFQPQRSGSPPKKKSKTERVKPETVAVAKASVTNAASAPALEAVIHNKRSTPGPVARPKLDLVVNNTHELPRAVAASEPLSLEANTAPLQHSDTVLVKEVLIDAETWLTISDEIGLKGMSNSILKQCAFEELNEFTILIRMEKQFFELLNDKHRERINSALSEYYGRQLSISASVGIGELETPAAYQIRMQELALNKAKQALSKDAYAQELIRQFSATIDPGSIEPISVDIENSNTNLQQPNETRGLQDES